MQYFEWFGIYCTFGKEEWEQKLLIYKIETLLIKHNKLRPLTF